MPPQKLPGGYDSRVINDKIFWRAGRPDFGLSDLFLVFVAAFTYYFAYLSSYQLSQFFQFSHSTSWFYLPSGVRLLLTLILMGPGALGVMLGTLAIDYIYHDSHDHLYNWVTASVAGLSAYVALLLAQRMFRLEATLARLSQLNLLGICMVFALVSPLMHQIWYRLNHNNESFLSSFAVMALGDLGGSVLVLYAIQWLMRLLRLLRTG